MSAINLARRSLPAVLIAASLFLGRAAAAQSSAPATADSTPAAVSPRLDTIKVKATAKKSRSARERDLIVGNRFLAKELARYDKRILELEKKLDSLRIEAAHRWKEARETEAAATATRERRMEMERRLAVMEADSARRAIIAGPK